MPELPDVTVYVERLAALLVGRVLESIRIRSPFLLRSFDPPISTVNGRTLRATRRLGKRIVLTFDGDLHLVLHLMVAGRLKWRPKKAAIPGRLGLAAFDFENGTLLLTEASQKKRASLELVRGESGIAALDRGGLEPIGSELSAFRDALLHENRTLKRALTDPRLFSGIGNAYSDEILHRARLSPVKLTHSLQEDDIERLHDAVQKTLALWTDRLREETGEGFPEKVTAFREGMAVHGKFQEPCPDCGTKVQRIVYQENETNYCPTCQTGGKLLADRALSRLLKGDWPRSLDALEESKERRRV